jgi:hypothetical protein
MNWLYFLTKLQNNIQIYLLFTEETFTIPTKPEFILFLVFMTFDMKMIFKKLWASSTVARYWSFSWVNARGCCLICMKSAHSQKLADTAGDDFWFARHWWAINWRGAAHTGRERGSSIQGGCGSSRPLHRWMGIVMHWLTGCQQGRQIYGADELTDRDIDNRQTET